ncbi:phosphate ABC transporter substrate-binding protein [Eubacterium sp. MSJ-13]|uniref:phosphate ABC transporter substrate-binding protein n=1 Tax=Eubacterium sp. MSJ-13 TaxID=2841513 RepID=UPI00209C8641|nr:phosphate ABC transporter substrate-binding protein [Eubacterium sp. MSJ-13]
MRTKKRLLVAAMVSALTLTSLTGCGSSSNGDSASSGASSGTSSSADASSSADLSGSVATDGSTSMEKVVGALGEAFMEANPNVKFTYNPTGSGSGITAVTEGRCDIGLSSRALTDDEKNQGLEETILAYDGIAIVVNPENKVKDLKVSQIADIYTGKIKNWSDVGGAKGDIVLIGREAGSGTRDGFESITGTEDKCKYKQELTSTGDVITTVANNPNAIGYASLASVDDSVKALSVDGVAPSEDTVKDASYKIQRPFVFVTKKDTKLSDAAQGFFDYAMGAAETITAAGVVPANEK